MAKTIMSRQCSKNSELRELYSELGLVTKKIKADKKPAFPKKSQISIAVSSVLPQ